MADIRYLVIRADRSMRVAKRPRVAVDEIAIRLKVNFPRNWGRVLEGDIEIDVPDFTPEVSVDAEEQV